LRLAGGREGEEGKGRTDCGTTGEWEFPVHIFPDCLRIADGDDRDTESKRRRRYKSRKREHQ
jgi:hypothetical protein